MEYPPDIFVIYSRKSKFTGKGESIENVPFGADYYKKDKPEIRSMQVIVAKHRNGAVGDVDLTFEPGISTFFNAAKKGEEMDES